MSILYETVSTVKQLDQSFARVAETFAADVQKGVFTHALVMFSAFFASWHLFAAIFALTDYTKVLLKHKLIRKDPVRSSGGVCFVYFVVDIVSKGVVVFCNADSLVQPNFYSTSSYACCCSFQDCIYKHQCSLLVVSCSCISPGSRP